MLAWLNRKRLQPEISPIAPEAQRSDLHYPAETEFLHYPETFGRRPSIEQSAVGTSVPRLAIAAVATLVVAGSAWLAGSSLFGSTPPTGAAPTNASFRTNVPVPKPTPSQLTSQTTSQGLTQDVPSPALPDVPTVDAAAAAAPSMTAVQWPTTPLQMPLAAPEVHAVAIASPPPAAGRDSGLIISPPPAALPATVTIVNDIAASPGDAQPTRMIAALPAGSAGSTVDDTAHGRSSAVGTPTAAGRAAAISPSPAAISAAPAEPEISQIVCVAGCRQVQTPRSNGTVRKSIVYTGVIVPLGSESRSSVMLQPAALPAPAASDGATAITCVAGCGSRPRSYATRIQPLVPRHAEIAPRRTGRDGIVVRRGLQRRVH